MSSLNYNNPNTPYKIGVQGSVPNTSTIGVSFSVFDTGGYMEFYNLTDLIWYYSGGSGQITGSSIPINFVKGTGTPINPDYLVLNSDNISTGRRRLGMLAYVQETGLIYQFSIPNYDNLWNSVTGLTGASAITISDYATIIRANSQPGIDFINAWTSTTIDGYNSSWFDANWKVLPGSYAAITGGTYVSGTSTLNLFNSTGGTLQISGFTTLLSVSANTGLGVENNELYTIYNSTLQPSLEMPQTIGGLSASTTVESLTAKTFVQLFNDLLFPEIEPTYQIPTLSFTGTTITGTREVGETISQICGVRGQKYDAGNFYEYKVFRNNVEISAITSANTSWNITSAIAPSLSATTFGYANPNFPNSAFTINYVDTFSQSNTGTTTWKIEASYLQGQKKLTNKGNVDPSNFAVRLTTAPQSASQDLNVQVSVNFIYPYFYGTSITELTIQDVLDSISGGTATKVVSSGAGNITIPYNSNQNFHWFAFFSGYSLKTQWFISADNKGLISSTSLFDPGVLTNTTSSDGRWSNQNFNIYLGNYATTIQSVIVGSGLF